MTELLTSLTFGGLTVAGAESAPLARLVTCGAQALLALVAGRLLLAMALGLAARAWSGRPAARYVGRAAVRISPAFARTTVRALACSGLALTLAAPAVASPVAAPPATRPSVTRSTTVPVLDRVVVPLLEGSALSWRDPPRTPLPSRPVSRPHPGPAAGSIHVVRPGESLWSIAAGALGPTASARQVAHTWPRWFARNRTLLGPDPGHLEPGQQLHVPAEGSR